MSNDVLPLNQGQQAAADGFFAFLLSDATEMIISGAGGVGKTFLMGHMIDIIMPQYFDACKLMGLPVEYHDVVMTATTNQAAEVVGLQTGRPAQTVHSFLNLKVTDNYQTGESILSKNGAWQVHTGLIIFIDECSMIDTPLWRMIQEGTSKCKIVYVGDRFQAAPIKESLSPIYNQNLEMFELTQPMRNQNQPALQELCQQLRHTVDTGEFFPIKLVPGVIDLLSPEQMEAELCANFLEQNNSAQILAYTNQRVTDYNCFIRSVRSLPPQFQKGEYLISNSAIRLKTAMLSVGQEILIVDQASQSEMVEITSDAELEVVMCTLQNPYGDMHYNVPIPVDADHFTQLANHFRKTKNWNRYFFLKNTFPDLRQRDAKTFHKAQGSTCDTVYIDLTNLSTCRNPDQVARLFYVAVSRPRCRVAFFGDLSEKFGHLYSE
jgi:exodeoxyribonuclease-5